MQTYKYSHISIPMYIIQKLGTCNWFDYRPNEISSLLDDWKIKRSGVRLPLLVKCRSASIHITSTFHIISYYYTHVMW